MSALSGAFTAAVTALGGSSALSWELRRPGAFGLVVVNHWPAPATISLKRLFKAVRNQAN